MECDPKRQLKKQPRKPRGCFLHNQRGGYYADRIFVKPGGEKIILRAMKKASILMKAEKTYGWDDGEAETRRKYSALGKALLFEYGITYNKLFYQGETK